MKTLSPPVAVMSFDPHALASFGEAAPELPRGLVAEQVSVMTALNRDASAAAVAAGASAMTDVTGFGLLGHVHELAEASGLAAEIDASAIPAIDGVLELLRTLTRDARA